MWGATFCVTGDASDPQFNPQWCGWHMSVFDSVYNLTKLYKKPRHIIVGQIVDLKLWVSSIFLCVTEALDFAIKSIVAWCLNLNYVNSTNHMRAHVGSCFCDILDHCLKYILLEVILKSICGQNQWKNDASIMWHVM